MKLPDLNLIIALDALLEEGSVIGAARRMNLSPPAMSRTLTRIREQLGDPILVKTGRRMVPTPRALALREQVHQTMESAITLLQPESVLSLAALERTFTLHANDVFISAYGGVLLARLREEAPNVGIRFTPENGSDEDSLRDGKVDLYISAMRPCSHCLALGLWGWLARIIPSSTPRLPRKVMPPMSTLASRDGGGRGVPSINSWQSRDCYGLSRWWCQPSTLACFR
jgi:DNA-binding transcriptional LysR family regulator